LTILNQKVLTMKLDNIDMLNDLLASEYLNESQI